MREPHVPRHYSYTGWARRQLWWWWPVFWLLIGYAAVMMTVPDSDQWWPPMSCAVAGFSLLIAAHCSARRASAAWDAARGENE